MNAVIQAWSKCEEPIWNPSESNSTGTVQNHTENNGIILRNVNVKKLRNIRKIFTFKHFIHVQYNELRTERFGCFFQSIQKKLSL